MKRSIINLDNIAIVYLLWYVICVMRSVQTGIGRMVLLKIVIMSSAFILARAIRDKSWILGGVMTAGTLQAIFVTLQIFGIAGSNHELFEITGFLGNPGQLGGFQAVSFVSAITLYAQRRSRIWKTVIPTSAALIFFSLILSDSRAGLVAAIAGIILLTHKSWSSNVKKIRWFYAVFSCFICLSALLLYHYRPESINARLFIWRICANMFMEKPLLGFGNGGFNMNYMLYQGEYISLHAGVDFSAIADNVAYPYNEFIHILIEQGLVGFVLFVIMIISGIQEIQDNHRSCAPLVAFLVFSTFSYPSYKLALGIMLPLLLGILPTRAFMPSQWMRKATTVVSIITVTLCITAISYSRHRFHNLLSDNFNHKETARTSECIENFFIHNYSDLKINAQYVAFARERPEILNYSTIPRIFPSSDSWCTIGRHYILLHKYEKAQKYFSQAVNMVPGLIQPKYLLWQTYIHQGKEYEAKEIADTILRMKVKVENTYTLRIRNEVINYNYANQHNIYQP